VNCEYRKTILQANGIELTLGGNHILSGLSLEVKDLYRPGMVTGQVAALLGPSGIGKTRLFRILAGMDKPDKGSVLIGEAAVPVERGMVGVVAQDYPLFEHRTVRGNLMVAAHRARLRGDGADAKVDEMLKRFGLADRGALYPCQLSGGQRQRAAIAQQFICSEHFLLMDEPFSGLDLIAVQDVCRMIQEVANSDELNTIIVITHDIAAAVTVADTIWLLGRDRDEHGNIIPGAKVKTTYNLVERGLAWHENIAEMPEFGRLVLEIRGVFPSL